MPSRPAARAALLSRHGRPGHVRRRLPHPTARRASDGGRSRVVQSWLTSTARRDRAVFQGVTDRKELAVRLPSDAAADRTLAFVNGRQVGPRVLADGRLLVSLAGQAPDEDDPATRRFVVDLQYDFRGSRPPQGSLRLEFPRLDHDTWIRRMYWQLVLPANEHLISNPERTDQRIHLDLGGLFLGSAAAGRSGQLESWAGATPRDPLPEQANCYLFSGLGPIEQAEVGTAERTWIVLWASGAALVAGMLLIYVPGIRHPAVLLVLGIGILAVGAIAPEPTLLLAQAAILGLGLTLAAALWIAAWPGDAGLPAARAGRFGGRTGFQPQAAATIACRQSFAHRNSPSGAAARGGHRAMSVTFGGADIPVCRKWRMSPRQTSNVYPTVLSSAG